VHLVGFIIRIYHDARSHERQKLTPVYFRYGMDTPVIEYRWLRDFLRPSRPAQDLSQPSVPWVSGLCPWGKTAGAWR